VLKVVLLARAPFGTARLEGVFITNHLPLKVSCQGGMVFSEAYFNSKVNLAPNSIEP
jgi:hypothetical protein